ncbi:MAG: hypothetical protein JWO89_967 [Verrucomicrobiaceae bacterium]|nr:hypothetical protein [Verrucomicrobiaceae bacterium]
MSPFIKIRIAGALSLFAFTSGALADSKPQCDTIARDVEASVTKEPTKVLMIVEDALVINESCACEIVKTAIRASHADAGMVKQIVQTALAVAPKMAPIIMECSGTSAVEGKTETVARATASGKDAKNVLPESVVPPRETGDSDYSSGPRDIRGLYLMQPAFGGGFASNDSEEEEEDDHGGKKPRKPRGPRRPVVTPLSPSCSCVDP